MAKPYTLFLCLLLTTSSVIAKHLPDDIEPGDSTNEIRLPLTKQSAAELVKIETNGKVLSVDLMKGKKRKVFRVKVLHTNGKVKNHHVDAATGHSIH
jgi:uncharacterized membrane protein YkoI